MIRVTVVYTPSSATQGVDVDGRLDRLARREHDGGGFDFERRERDRDYLCHGRAAALRLRARLREGMRGICRIRVTIHPKEDDFS